MNHTDLVERLMHRDRCTILRAGAREDEQGVTHPGEPAPVYKDIPCKVSQKSLSALTPDGLIARVNYQHALYVHPRYKLQEGDTVEVVLTDGTALSARIGGFFPYSMGTAAVLTGEEIA